MNKNLKNVSKFNKTDFVKVLFFLLILSTILTGCRGRGEVEKSVSKEYPEVSENAQIYYKSEDEISKLLEHGTGVVFLSIEDCKWCHYYIKFVEELSEKYDIKIAVFDIENDRKNDTNFYQNLVQKLSPFLEENLCYDVDGNLRIFAPTILFISEGKIIGFDTESSMENSENSPENYWQEIDENGQTKEYNLRKKLFEYGDKIKEKILEIESRGCTDSCEVD